MVVVCRQIGSGKCGDQTWVFVQVAKEGVGGGGAEVGLDAVDGEVHVRQSPSRGVGRNKGRNKGAATHLEIRMGEIVIGRDLDAPDSRTAIDAADSHVATCETWLLCGPSPWELWPTSQNS